MSEIAIICDTESEAGIIADKLSSNSEGGFTAYAVSSLPLWESGDIEAKVYVMSDPEVLAAQRLIDERRRLCEENIRDELNKISAERQSSRRAILDKCCVDINELSNFSVVIDRGALSFDEIAEYALSALSKGNEKTVVYTSTDRLNFPDDEADAEMIAEYSDLASLGGELPLTDVFYENGEFYIVGAPEAALAASFVTDALIPCRLVSGKRDTSGYVKMKNSL